MCVFSKLLNNLLITLNECNVVTYKKYILVPFSVMRIVEDFIWITMEILTVVVVVVVVVVV